MSKYPEKKKERHETDISTLTRVTSPTGAAFIDKYNLHQQADKLLWDDERNMVVFKYKDTIQGKAVNPTQEPKCFTYSWKEDPYMAFNEESDSLIIVEDPCSAARASELINAMALLGTTWHNEYSKFIRQYDKLFVALDHTATDKAIKLVQYLNLLRPCRLIVLTTDIKDLSTEDLQQMLDVAGENWINPDEELPW